MIGKRLKAARKLARLTQEELAERTNMELMASSISHYENETHSPSFSVACQLAEVLDVPECWLYCRDDMLANTILESHKKNIEFRITPEEIAQLKSMDQQLENLLIAVKTMIKKRK